ncbi:MAG: tRNA (adenosine(37)-N6)-threonylcarbamoyltransferase complex transferase subunit TsaD, partial [Thermoguttaceae bacterium]
ALSYPGGPSIERAAKMGDSKKHQFPRPFLNDPDRLAFSFSGLKTAVRYLLVGPGKETNPATVSATLSPPEISDIAASFQEAAVDCLVGKTIHAIQKSEINTLCIGGGVAANKRFREKMEMAATQIGVRLFIAPFELCTDNAVMGAIALERFSAGFFETLDLDISPGLLR